MTRGTQARDGGGRLRLGWRSAAIATAIAATGTIALVALNHPAPDTARYTVGDSNAPIVVSPDDPLRVELARCRTLPATSEDTRCQGAWEVNRRRFMGESRSGQLPPVAAAAPAPLPATSVAER